MRKSREPCCTSSRRSNRSKQKETQMGASGPDCSSGYNCFTLRLIVQGIPASVIKELPPGKAVKAAGNAFSVPLIVAVVTPLLRAVLDKLGDLRNIIGSYSTSEKRSKSADAEMGMKQRRRMSKSFECAR